MTLLTVVLVLDRPHVATLAVRLVTRAALEVFGETARNGCLAAPQGPQIEPQVKRVIEADLRLICLTQAEDAEFWVVGDKGGYVFEPGRGMFRCQIAMALRAVAIGYTGQFRLCTVLAVARGAMLQGQAVLMDSAVVAGEAGPIGDGAHRITVN
jgi:hypothetical protein